MERSSSSRPLIFLVCILAVLLACPYRVRADSWQRVTYEKLNIELAAGDTITHINIPLAKDQKVTLSALPSPGRLIIDLGGISGRRPKNFPVSVGPIKAVRVGIHADKLRVVIDTDSPAAPRYQWTQTDDLLEIVLQHPDAAPAQSTAATPARTALPSHSPVASRSPAPTATETPAPTLTVTATVTPTPTARATATSTPVPLKSPVLEPSPALIAPPALTETPTATPTAAAMSSPALTSAATLPPPLASLPASAGPTGAAVLGPNDAAITLLSMDFSFVGEQKSPTVRLMLDGRSEFSFTRKGDKTYGLTLPRVRLAGSFLRLPQFPPRDFIGVTVVSADASIKGVEITIYVGQGVRINAVARANEIWISPLNK